jgi:hypothetical protein
MKKGLKEVAKISVFIPVTYFLTGIITAGLFKVTADSNLSKGIV